MNDIKESTWMIAGLGSIGQRHIKNITTLGIQNIILLRTGKGVLASPELDKYPVITDISDILKKKPDVVIISNPTSLHMPVALTAAKAGCHLFLEKPVSHHADGLTDLAALVKKNRLVTQVGFQFRFHPALQTIHAWIDDKKIGKLISAHVHWGEFLPSWHPWEDYRQSYSARKDLGGGVLLTLCHPFDYLRWICGKVTSVTAMAGHFSGLQTDTEDTAITTIRFSCGSVGSVYLDYIQNPPEHHLILIGDKGTIRWNSASGCAELEQTGKEKQFFKAASDFERNTLFMDEMKHFISSIQNGTESKCNLEEGIHALEIVLAAKQSALERREVEISSIL